MCSSLGDGDACCFSGDTQPLVPRLGWPGRRLVVAACWSAAPLNGGLPVGFSGGGLGVACITATAKPIQAPGFHCCTHMRTPTRLTATHEAGPPAAPPTRSACWRPPGAQQNHVRRPPRRATRRGWLRACSQSIAQPRQPAPPPPPPTPAPCAPQLSATTAQILALHHTPHTRGHAPTHALITRAGDRHRQPASPPNRPPLRGPGVGMVYGVGSVYCEQS